MTFKEYAMVKTAAEYANNGTLGNDVSSAMLVGSIGGSIGSPVEAALQEKYLGIKPKYGLLGNIALGGASGALSGSLVGALLHAVREGVFD